MLASPEKKRRKTSRKRVEEWTAEESPPANLPTNQPMIPRPNPPAEVQSNADGSAPPGAGPLLVWLEDKYDGIRCQLHKVRVNASHFTFARFEGHYPPHFLEIGRFHTQKPRGDFILDGEVVAMRGRADPAVCRIAETSLAAAKAISSCARKCRSNTSRLICYGTTGRASSIVRWRDRRRQLETIRNEWPGAGALYRSQIRGPKSRESLCGGASPAEMKGS